MKTSSRYLLFLFLLAGCAGYKELQPEPSLMNVERGYVELKVKNENFKLEQGKKYFMKFPGSQADHFYLILVTSAKPVLTSYMSSTFDGSKESTTPIKDETQKSKNTSVYAINTNLAGFYWVIDTVRFDTTLILQYRYVPQWRYTFENRYAEFQKTLAENIVPRTTYNAIGPNFDVDGLDLKREISNLGEKNSKLNNMKSELLRLETIFPKGIATSRDTAYERYVTFRKKVDEELTFQGNYASVLNFFQKERETRGSTDKFLEAVPYFTGVMSQSSKFPPPLTSRMSSLMMSRLSEVTPYIENILNQKDDATKIASMPSLDDIGGLYRECGQQIPLDIQGTFQFVQRFNDEVDSLQMTTSKFPDVQSYFDNNLASPPQSFYVDLLTKIADIKTSLPDPEIGGFTRYAKYKCGKLLTDEIVKSKNRAEDLGKIYEGANSVSRELNSRSWASAEINLRQLSALKATSDFPEISQQKNAFVKKFESEIFSSVKTATEQRIDGFIQNNSTVIENVTRLYSDSSFYPVYQFTYSALGANEVVRKRKQIEEYLTQAKYYRFPETSIKNIYEEFARNSRERGVEKARAIVEHGKFYKGTDKQVKGLITECDVQAAKWIIKPKEYRKLFALPVSDNTGGENEYMFRIQLQIPSEGEFPVFDVNLKLPEEISGNAGESQWYESITIDKKPIKNEGRFRITSPTADNNYESLITPVQMDKEGKNILEVRFRYSGFRVFEVSAMAQVPIIRKN